MSDTTDVRLYMALKNIMNGYETLVEDAGGRGAESFAEVIEAKAALAEFEENYGPLPEWAIARNWDYAVIRGAQLCTRDGRVMGNAYIIDVRIDQYGPKPVKVYECLTDAGSKFTFTEPEILAVFTIGDWVSDVKKVLRKFDRDGHFSQI